MSQKQIALPEDVHWEQGEICTHYGAKFTLFAIVLENYRTNFTGKLWHHNCKKSQVKKMTVH
jgi:hypothetical protein